ncbi:hypothetical protein PG993_002038 [Apiospora rasikravindrae]|uniref:Uncharacterized protein n=1 Tax=Apiospora rasikravindrae TaxID=990691 RepID=A0ABR1UFB6_9PEZI
MANLDTRKRDIHNLADESVPAPKRYHTEAANGQRQFKQGPHAEYFEKRGVPHAVYPKAIVDVVEALDSALEETEKPTGSLPADSVYLVLRSEGERLSRYSDDPDLEIVGVFRDVVGANYKALRNFEETAHYQEETPEVVPFFRQIKTGPEGTASDQGGWLIDQDACLRLCAGPDVDGEAEVWVERRELEG